MSPRKVFWHWDFWGLNHQFWLSKSFPNHFRPLTNRITWFRFSNSPFTLYLWPALQRQRSLCNKNVVNFRKTTAFDDLINHRYTPCLKSFCLGHCRNPTYIKNYTIYMGKIPFYFDQRAFDLVNRHFSYNHVYFPPSPKTILLLLSKFSTKTQFSGNGT